MAILVLVAVPIAMLNELNPFAVLQLLGNTNSPKNARLSQFKTGDVRLGAGGG